jgi:hypothetical protein
MKRSAPDRMPIGIFTFGGSPIDHMPPLRTRALLAEAALQGAELFFFSAGDCQPSAGRIAATYWNKSGWARQDVPLPGLVNILTDAIRPLHHQIDAWLQENATVVADRGPDKIEQVRMLEQSALAAHAIPSALIAPEGLEAQLAEFLSRNAGAVIKPVVGERGGNIYFILPDGDRFRLTTRRRPPVEGSLGQVAAALGTAIDRRLRYRHFMVQRYIDSRERDMPLALRVDVHKRPDESWALVRTAMRLNVAGGFATHIDGGATQGMLERFLARRVPGRDQQILNQAVTLAMEAAKLIDARPDASIMELGVDLVMDSADHLWIVETNVHPGAYWAEHERAIHTIAYLLSRSR